MMAILESIIIKIEIKSIIRTGTWISILPFRTPPPSQTIHNAKQKCKSLSFAYLSLIRQSIVSMNPPLTHSHMTPFKTEFHSQIQPLCIRGHIRPLPSNANPIGLFLPGWLFLFPFPFLDFLFLSFDPFDLAWQYPPTRRLTHS